MSGKLPFWGGVAAGAAGSALAIAGVKYIQGQRQISRDVDAFREHWAEPRAQHPDDGVGREHPEGVVHYVALGDSAAQGVGASHVGASYVALLGRRISLATGRSVAITNLSVSGAISGDVVAGQLPALAELGFEPDIVTLDIGGNDVVFAIGNTVESFAASFDKYASYNAQIGAPGDIEGGVQPARLDAGVHGDGTHGTRLRTVRRENQPVTATVRAATTMSTRARARAASVSSSRSR